MAQTNLLNMVIVEYIYNSYLEFVIWFPMSTINPSWKSLVLEYSDKPSLDLLVWHPMLARIIKNHWLREKICLE